MARVKMAFLTSATEAKGFPLPNRPEVAFAGRSNAGKSSLLNAMSGQKVAKVSGTPGKTTLLNFFDVGEDYRIVDMPGYGYAARSKQMVQGWKKMIESYLSDRECLRGLCLIMDIRRKWTEEEQLFVDWLSAHDRGVVVLLNKCDKISRSEALKCKKKVIEQAGVKDVFIVSASKVKGLDEVRRHIFNEWVKPK